MGNGQWAMGNGQWAVGSGQWAVRALPQEALWREQIAAMAIARISGQNRHIGIPVLPESAFAVASRPFGKIVASGKCGYEPRLLSISSWVARSKGHFEEQ